MYGSRAIELMWVSKLSYPGKEQGCLHLQDGVRGGVFWAATKAAAFCWDQNRCGRQMLTMRWLFEM